MHLLAPFILQNFYKKILELIQSYEDMRPFWDQNNPLSWTNFFGTNHYYFHLPIGRFHCAKIKKILTTDPELWRCTIFGPKVVHLPQTIFFWKIITTILIYLLAPFIVQNLKKTSSGSRVMWMCNLWARNGRFPQIRIFSEKLLISLVSFIHAYLHAKIKVRD